MNKEVIYDKNMEKQIDDIFLIMEDSSNLLDELEKLYKETKYPGVLYHIGKEYYFGSCACEEDKEKGFSYLKRSADARYIEAIKMLGELYTFKALDMLKEASIYHTLLIDMKEATLSLGTNKMASYLLSSNGAYFHEYDTYYEGLELVAKANEDGCSEAKMLLHVLNKDEIFIRKYKQKIKEEREICIKKMYTYNEDDFKVE